MVASAALIVGLATFVVKVAAMLKEVAVAHEFGTSSVLDAFYIAYLLPSFATNVLAGAVETSFQPKYIEVRERQGSRAARAYFGDVLIVFSGVLTLVAGACFVAAPVVLPVLGSGFSPAKLELTATLFRWLLPFLVLKTIAIFFTRTLNAEGSFGLPAMAPLAVPITILAALVLLVGRIGIYALVVGVLLGTLLELAVIGIDLVRSKVVPKWGWSGRVDDLRDTLNQFAPMLAGGLLMASADLVDQSMAAALGPGSVASLNYGNRVVGGVLAVGATGVGTAVLPHFSTLVAKGNWRELEGSLRRNVKLIVLVGVPLAAVLIFLSEPIIRVLFEHGEFNAGDTRLVAAIQALYLLQIPVYVLTVLLGRLVSSLKSNQVLMWGAAISLVANISLNYLFSRWMGVKGIALSTSVVYLLSVAYLTVVLRGLLSRRREGGVGE